MIPSPGWKVTVADVSSCSGAWPLCARPFDSAIEKHVACAAAISSSGLVNSALSLERAAHETSCSPILPVVVDVILPLPSVRLPFHVTSALRSVATYVPSSSSALTVTSTPAFFSSVENGQPASAAATFSCHSSAERPGTRPRIATVDATI